MTWAWRGVVLAAAICLPAVLSTTALAQAEAPAKPNGSAIRGTVVNAQTNAPVADAKVTLVEMNLTAKTSQDGRI